MIRDGRLVRKSLALRAAIPPDPEVEESKPRWRMCIPDVFSIRNSTVQRYLEPIVHEIKVSRADLCITAPEEMYIRADCRQSTVSNHGPFRYPFRSFAGSFFKSGTQRGADCRELPLKRSPELVRLGDYVAFQRGCPRH